MPTPDANVESLVNEALAVVRSDRLPYLATVEGDQPRLRPVTPVKTDGFIVYIANLRTHSKTAEIEANPRVELCYLDGHNDQVRITGRAEAVDDPALRDEFAASAHFLPRSIQGLTSPDFMLYRIIPTRVRFMKGWALAYEDVPIPGGATESGTGD
ncbi:General stress protein 26 [Aquisphaera giovannonii]|uniref:General stress protein 26 n=1 Tax=Aquisphaera giovannonii TaxID=406548 RepID=A0A5B9W0S1_9BACT|nr:pyridoxamine 5'-phosphate oxidase family protein [Aquisphaera giovannonii]QEH33555.1 General stress protein 26 [Aquisphaera giovannonii]